MKKTVLALLACSAFLSASSDDSFLPFEDTLHPERYHTDLDTPPLACHTAKPHFKIYYFDEDGCAKVIFKVSAIRIDEMGIYFNKSDIIGKKVCRDKRAGHEKR